jgi:hypothetical protein
MNETPDRLADAIRRVLKEEMGRSPAVRELLVELAELVLVEAEELKPRAEHGVAAEPVSVAETASDTVQTESISEGSIEPEPASAEPRAEKPITADVPLALGGPVMDIKVTGTASEISGVKQTIAGPSDDDGAQQEAPTPKPIDLDLIEERARLKAESCRFYIERRRDRGDPVLEPTLKTRMDSMITTAKSMQDCFLWVFWPHEDQPADDQLKQIAACYDALAESVTACRRAVAPDGRLSTSETQQAFQLLAEATSALRVALGVTWLTSDDIDQEESHLWLRRETHARGIFVERHMKLDDPAKPEDADDIAAEVKRLLAAEEARLKKAKKIDQAFNKAIYHARRVRNAHNPDRHDIETINRMMEELRTMGIGPTDARVAEFRESLEGVEFPVDLPRHEHLSFESQPTNVPASGPADLWNDRVAEVRPFLEGGRIVIIGGEPRPEAIKRFEDAFGATPDWVELTEHGSGARMQASIERPDTRVVLVLIKLTGHLHADEAREYARSAGVPCVNVEAGYNPNMVAEQVMSQVGERLSAGAP